MKKQQCVLALTGFIAIAFIACNLNSTDSGKTEAQTFEKLPVCSVESSASGISYLNQKLFVEEENLYYLCTEEGWIVSDSSSSAYPSENVIENLTVTGVAKAVGYFEVKTPIVLHEALLDSNKKELLISGLKFVDEISSNDGDFIIPKVSLHSSYAVLSAKGLFFDIFTGKISDDSLEFKSLVNLSQSSSITVNFITHLEYKRALVLLKNGYSLDAAIAQAETELLNAFGFVGKSIDEVSIALSVLFRRNLDEDEFISGVDDFIKDFSEDGTWDDADSKTTIADFAFNLQNLKIKDEETGNVILKEDDYRKHLESFGKEDIPVFELLLTKYWNANYGLYNCGKASEGVVLKNANESSNSAKAYFTCDASAWRPSTTFERDTCSLGDAIDGELKEGNFDSSVIYAYDTTGLGVNSPLRWVKADSIAVLLQESCTDSEDETKGKIVKTEDKDGNDNFWACSNRTWTLTTKTAYDIGYICSEENKNVVEILVDGDKKSYYRCSNSSLTWSWTIATEADYATRDEQCVLDELIVVSKTSYVCADSSSMSFRDATDTEKDLNTPCNQYQIGKSVTGEASDSYVCGCSVYDAESLEMVTKTTLDECEYLPLSWIKD